MAFYDDWKKKADASGYYFSDDDLARASIDPVFAAAIYRAKDDYNTAKLAGDQAGMDRAHSAAEQARYGYNYSGGNDGSEYNPWENTNPASGNYSVFKSGSSRPHNTGTGAKRPEYTPQYQGYIDSLLSGALDYPDYVSPYADKIDSTLNGIMNRPAFRV